MAKKQEDKIEKLNASVEYKGEGDLLSDISSSEPLNPIYACEKCGKEYKTKSGLTKHSKTCVVQLEDTIFNVDKVLESVKEQPITVKVTKTVEVKPEPTMKEMYEKMIDDGAFILKINGTIVFDSDVDNIMSLSFTEDYFRIDKNKFPYLGLNFKYKK